MVDEAVQIQRMMMALNKIVGAKEPVDSSNVVLFNAPPTDPTYFADVEFQ